MPYVGNVNRVTDGEKLISEIKAQVVRNKATLVQKYGKEGAQDHFNSFKKKYDLSSAYEEFIEQIRHYRNNHYTTFFKSTESSGLEWTLYQSNKTVEEKIDKVQLYLLETRNEHRNLYKAILDAGNVFLQFLKLPLIEGEIEKTQPQTATTYTP